MIELRKIFHCFRPSEISQIKELIRLRNKSCDNRKYQLLELIEKNTGITDAQAVKLIYGNKNSGSAFSHLKDRLKKDLLDFLHQKGQDRVVDLKVAHEIKAQKLYTQGLILYYQDLKDIAFSSLTEALKISEKYELFHIKLAIYEFIGTHLKKESREAVWEQYQYTISELENLYHLKADFYLPQKSSWDGPSGTSNLNSTSSLFWYYKIHTKKMEDQKDYLKADQYSQKMLSALEAKPNLFTREEVLATNLTKARLCIYQDRLDDAVRFSKQAINHPCSHDSSKIRALEILFYVFFYRHEWEKAEKTSQKAISYLSEDTMDRCKWDYFMANLTFAKGRFRDSVKILSTKSISINNQNFLLNKRLLEMLNLIEMRDYDWLDFKMDNFRKAARKVKSDYITRCKKINLLVKRLAANRFNFCKTCDDEASLIEELSQTSGPFARDPMGFELIDIPRWFKDKASGNVNSSNGKIT